ncbi:MAG: elements of external origin [Magnetospirillum sp.]|nr:MAG: elements of external origin [Magnetospirillum sp.]
MGLSIRAYARHRGVSHVSVLRAAKAGRIPQEPDGTIDPAKADAAWDAQTDPARKAPPPAPEKATPIPPAILASPSPPHQRDSLPSTGANFAQARTAHEVAKAQKARIQVQRLKDEVIDRANALALVFKLARQERDAWVGWPARVAGLMAAEIGIDPHVMQVLLETHVRAHLNELADIKPDFH